MSRKDQFHQAVKNAIEKDGWLITHDPMALK
jgi:XisH protein